MAAAKAGDEGSEDKSESATVGLDVEQADESQDAEDGGEGPKIEA